MKSSWSKGLLIKVGFQISPQNLPFPKILVVAALAWSSRLHYSPAICLGITTALVVGF